MERKKENLNKWVPFPSPHPVPAEASGRGTLHRCSPVCILRAGRGRQRGILFCTLSHELGTQVPGSAACSQGPWLPSLLQGKGASPTCENQMRCGYVKPTWTGPDCTEGGAGPRLQMSHKPWFRLVPALLFCSLPYFPHP